jgi:hypothetical protein
MLSKATIIAVTDMRFPNLKIYPFDVLLSMILMLVSNFVNVLNLGE